MTRTETTDVACCGRWDFLGMGRNSKYGSPAAGWGFLGMSRNSKYGHKNAGAAPVETPAHTCRFAQPYSSWGAPQQSPTMLQTEMQR